MPQFHYDAGVKLISIYNTVKRICEYDMMLSNSASVALASPREG